MSSLQATLESHALSRDWLDGERHRWLHISALPVMGLLSVVGAMAGGPGALLWLLPVVFYGIAPQIDLLIGTDSVNAPRRAFGYSRFQGTARTFAPCASTMSNAELTTRRLRS